MKLIQDEWGHDPSVQSMRRVFSSMEAAQEELLRHLNISPFDTRLRRSREQALNIFEQAWSLAIGKGMTMTEKDAASLYLHCLARAFNSVGVKVSKELLPGDEKIIRLLQKEQS
jgi:predicted trehalose synthase